MHQNTLTRPEATDSIHLMASYEARTRRFRRAEYVTLIEPGVFQPGEAGASIPVAHLLP